MKTFNYWAIFATAFGQNSTVENEEANNTKALNKLKNVVQNMNLWMGTELADYKERILNLAVKFFNNLITEDTKR